jgi:hypothetical protein
MSAVCSKYGLRAYEEKYGSSQKCNEKYENA